VAEQVERRPRPGGRGCSDSRARWRVRTANTRHFKRVEGLDILAISIAE